MSRYQWEKVRRLVLERDDHQCVRCAHGQQLQVHHRRPRGAGGTRRPEIAYGFPNLITVCLFCHEYIERNREISYRLGYLVRSGHNPATSPLWLPGREWVLLTDAGDIEPVRDIPEEITA